MINYSCHAQRAKRVPGHLVLLFFLSNRLFPVTTLETKATQFSSYFLEDKKIRHHRYELFLAQKTEIIPYRFSSIIEGRGRVDFALFNDSNAPRRNEYDARVVSDEKQEGEFRQFYFDYLGDTLQIKSGIRQIDWMETLITNAQVTTTPLDLRHGGMGDSGDLIEPQLLLSVSHGLFDGNLEWLIIPEPKSHKLPKGENGYGYVKKFQQSFYPLRPVIIEEKIGTNPDAFEFGSKYSLLIESWEWNVMAYHGHRKLPSYEILSMSTFDVFLREYYSEQNTFSTGFSYSTEDAIMRMNVLLQPSYDPTLQPEKAGFNNPKSKEQLIRFGFGLDYVVSKHFKIYSEQFFSRTDFSHQENWTAKNDEYPQIDYSANVRLTNETWDDVLLQLDSSLSKPKDGYYLSPSLKWEMNGNFRLTLGGRFFESQDEKSPYDVMKNSSQIFAKIDGVMTAGK